ncbi:MAG: ParB N-terminal domain-containing protein [Rhodobacteraceae bacterium]|nr:ParB N-terminal domain-containing protein [Paracoccaceae bacterium]
MPGKNKFGFGPLEVPPAARRERSVGPMGAAVREAAESLRETTDAKVEQRRRNAADAKAYREARQGGRILATLRVEEICTDDLPRDRLDLDGVAASDEMEELKASIRSRGQKEPIEVYTDDAGRYQLKKGWRRLTALRQLFLETGESRFMTVVARADAGQEGADRIAHYVDMVEENVIRQDLTFAEMAQVAIAAAADPAVEGTDPDAMVGRLYAALHKMKRSYIRSFVFLLTTLDGAAKWPKSISRNTGVDLARMLKAQPERAGTLRRMLESCATEEDQTAEIAAFLATGQKARRETAATQDARPPRRETREISVGALRVTARNGECRILGDCAFADIPRDRLERAIRLFEEALADTAGPRIKPLERP